MDLSQTLGLWSSSFGAVKIEPDTTAGNGRIMGVWLYDRAGQEVIGYFAGALRGNVLEFTWHEPAMPQDLIGGGYLVFDPRAGRFTGKWWTNDGARNGAWTGWRSASAQPPMNPTYGSGDAAPYPQGSEPPRRPY